MNGRGRQHYSESESISGRLKRVGSYLEKWGEFSLIFRGLGLGWELCRFAVLEIQSKLEWRHN
jgi:hypothetical protein